MPMTPEDLEQAVREGVDLSRGDFQDTDYSGAELMGARFEKCDFRCSDLGGAELDRADLRGADFTGACLDSVCVLDAKMDGAIFIRTSWIDASLDDSKVDFTGAIGIHDAGQDDRGYRFIGVWQDEDGPHGEGWMVKAGCRWFTLTEAREHWGPNGQDNDDAMERVEEIARAPRPSPRSVALTVRK